MGGGVKVFWGGLRGGGQNFSECLRGEARIFPWALKGGPEVLLPNTKKKNFLRTFYKQYTSTL